MKYKDIVTFLRSLYPNKDFIPLHEPYFAGNEKKYLADCIDTTFVSSVGKYVDRFEDMIREYTGAKYAIATVNGTAALHIALLLAGVQPGDLVITQPLTFIATCNAISYCGAKPVFVDVDSDTMGMSPESLESWLTQNVDVLSLDSFELEHVQPDAAFSTGRSPLNRAQPTQQDEVRSTRRSPRPSSTIAIHKTLRRPISACVPMHTFGHPCRIDKIVDICNRYHIPVVEDSAESLGSYYKDRHTGTFGKLGILSFNGNKTITTGGGGMVLTDDEHLGPLAKHITTTAKKPHPWKFEHDMVGYNYRLPNVNAALGCAQMEMLDAILANKRETAMLYRELFADIADIQYQPEPPHSTSNYWLNAILLKDQIQQETFLKETNENKVMTRPAWILMNELEMFKGSLAADLTVSKEIASRLVNIPSSARLV